MPAAASPTPPDRPPTAQPVDRDVQAVRAASGRFVQPTVRRRADEAIVAEWMRRMKRDASRLRTG